MNIDQFLIDSEELIRSLYKTTKDLDVLIKQEEPKAIVNGEPVYDGDGYFYSISGDTKGFAQLYAMLTNVEPSDIVFYMIRNQHLSDRF